MHTHDLSPWQHPHDFAPDRRASERRTWLVVAITGAMMAIEIAAGWWWNSMALLADGWHMGTHAVAIGVAGASYWLVRRWRADARFSFGPWKVEVLGAFSSALLLGVVAVSVTVESLVRLFRPETIAYDQSLVVAVIGLVVNLVCAKLLHHDHAHHDHGHDHHDDHDHDHDHDHHHHHAHGDLNLKAAYLHVLADAATSVLAIGALVAGKWFGWVALDPLVGLLGAVLIAIWARGLLAESATILLDREMDHPLADQVRARLEGDGDAKVCDLHLTRVGGERFAVLATVVADHPASSDAYRERLRGLEGVVHASIEVNRCPHAAG